MKTYHEGILTCLPPDISSHQRPRHSEILPEAMQKYTDIMHWLVRLPESSTKILRRKENTKPEQKEDELCPNPGLLSYDDELWSQDFVEQVSCIWSPGVSPVLG